MLDHNASRARTSDCTALYCSPIQLYCCLYGCQHIVVSTTAQGSTKGRGKGRTAKLGLVGCEGSKQSPSTIMYGPNDTVGIKSMAVLVLCTAEHTASAWAQSDLPCITTQGKQALAALHLGKHAAFLNCQRNSSQQTTHLHAGCTGSTSQN